MFDGFSKKSRARKLELFFEWLKPTKADRVLDVGGECDPSHHSLQLVDNYPWPQNVTAINLDQTALRYLKDVHPESCAVLGDATQMPFPDKSFDIVFSNAVIEHLHSLDAQAAMAKEIARVAKRWFVTTPNRWYPFEFHARMPLISWLPAPLMRQACRLRCWNHVERRYVSGLRLNEIRLLTGRELARIFPRSRVRPLRITVYPETLLVVGPTDSI